ncbi:hypothetical protein PR202_ga12513 [Eleusine coracana subsp. coracana]|uniref:Uncharacterized protein n=1 Tax=Eleusine coracana subsp. coracana TaxID=191504 RepID=A0AAV5CCB1_ELECO|nr:hypothetical protein PR202_ga12513 [Eleusine coracana subsp. coracana]
MPRKLVKKSKGAATVESSSSELDILEQLREFSKSTISTNTLNDMQCHPGWDYTSDDETREVLDPPNSALHKARLSKMFDSVLDTYVSHPPLPLTDTEGVDYAAKPLPQTDPARTSSSASALQTDSIDAGGSIVPDVNLPSPVIGQQYSKAKEQVNKLLTDFKAVNASLEQGRLDSAAHEKKAINLEKFTSNQQRYLDTLIAEKNDLAKSLKEQSLENAQLKKNLEETEEKLKQAKSSERTFKCNLASNLFPIVFAIHLVDFIF